MLLPNAPPLQNSFKNLPCPYKGYDPSSPLMNMSPVSAVILENFFPLPNGVETRDGFVTHITAIPLQCDRLHVYSAPNGAESLWGTTSQGIYDFTVAGAAPAFSMALTLGKTFSTSISTGAGSYLLMCNGLDTIKQYDGTTWTSIATFGATATSVYSYIETYRQRIFLVKKNSLEIEYLSSNSIAGAATNYPLGALFRLGGYIVAMGVWTIDGGIGPEDNLAVITSKGEIAVFAGNDPATWSLRGVYFIGRPLGDIPLYKYGGDILVLTETGIVPLSTVIQSEAIDRKQTVSSQIRPFLISCGQLAFASQGWQIISDPIKPLLLVNLPITPVIKQAVMNSQTGGWSTYAGLNAVHFARKGGELYYSATGTAGNYTVKRITGVSDDGANIVSTMLQAYNALGAAGNKKIELIKPYFEASAAYYYNAGVASNFKTAKEYTNITSNFTQTAALWGSAIWGEATWTGQEDVSEDFQTLTDEYSMWKALYLQTVSNKTKVTYFGTDLIYNRGGNF